MGSGFGWRGCSSACQGVWGPWGRNSPAWLPSHPKGTPQGQQQSQTSLQRCSQPHIFTPKLLDLPVPCFSPPRSLWSCFSKAPGEGADAFAFNLGRRGGVSAQNPSCLQAEGRQQTGFLLLTPVTPFPTRTQGHHPPRQPPNSQLSLHRARGNSQAFFSLFPSGSATSCPPETFPDPNSTRPQPVPPVRQRKELSATSRRAPGHRCCRVLGSPAEPLTRCRSSPKN